MRAVSNLPPYVPPRFTIMETHRFGGSKRIRDNFTHEDFWWKEPDIIARLNNIEEEKEYWKQSCVSVENENMILMHEIQSAIKEGYRLSESFRRYFDAKNRSEGTS